MILYTGGLWRLTASSPQAVCPSLYVFYNLEKKMRSHQTEMGREAGRAEEGMKEKRKREKEERSRKGRGRETRRKKEEEGGDVEE